MYLSKFNKVFKVGGDVTVLYNTLSGATDVTDWDILSGDVNLADEANRELLTYLKRRGYAFDKAVQERRAMGALYEAYNRHKTEVRPLIFYLVLSYHCNLSCRYCFQGSVKGSAWTLKEEDLAPIFRAIVEIQKLHPDTRTKPVVALYGGEPLLERHLGVVTRIYREISRRRWVTGPVISNGVELDAYIPLFQDHPPSGIQVTIDGPARVHDQRRILHGGSPTFHKIIANVRLALDAGLKIGIRSNIDRSNVDCLPEVVSIAEKEGWLGNEKVELNISPVHRRACGSLQENDRHDSLLKQVLQLMKEHPKLGAWNLDGWSVVNYFRRLLDEDQPVQPRFDHCEAAMGKSFHLDGQGNIYTCIEACGMEHLAAGRYKPTVAFNDLFHQLKQRNVMNLEPCADCGFSLICGGGCALSSIFDGKGIRAPHCANTVKSMERYVRFRFGEG